MIGLTLYDLMGEDHELNATLNADNIHVNMSIANESGNTVYQDETHIYAWEALVGFAHQIIATDKRIQIKKEIAENE